jgi:hypothetical protein
VQVLLTDFKQLQAELDDPLQLGDPGDPDFTTKKHRH